MKKKSHQLLIWISLLALVVLSACSNKEESVKGETEGTSSKGSKSVFVGITTPPTALNPINSREVNTQILSSILFESLFELDSSLEFLPKLAESMETEDNQSFVIKLHPDVKWTDGEAFTTKDIAFTLETMANPNVTSLGLSSLSIIEGLDEKGQLPDGGPISGIEIQDDTTMTVKTKIPVDINYLKEKLGVDIRFIPQHVLKDEELANLHQSEFMRNPNVTNGAYKFVKMANDQFVEFAANPDYYRGAPKIDKLFFKVLPSTNLVAQLQTGEVHINNPSVGPIAVDDLERIKNMSNIEMTTGEALFNQVLMVNTESIQDKKVRQAIAYSMNRDVLVNKVHQGMGEINEGPYPPAHPYQDESIKGYDYDPEKAKSLLEEADWDFDRTLDFAVPTGNKAREQAATIMAENLKAIGMKVEVNKYDLPTLLQKGAKKEFDIMHLGTPFSLDPDRSIYYQTGGAYNFMGYSNADVDKLLMEGRSEVDPDKRRVIYNKLTEIVQEDLPIITLYALKSPGAVSKQLVGAEPKDYGMFYNVHEWELK